MNLKEISLRGKETITIKVPEEWNTGVFRYMDGETVKHEYKFDGTYDDSGRQIFRYFKTVKREISEEGNIYR